MSHPRPTDSDAKAQADKALIVNFEPEDRDESRDPWRFTVRASVCFMPTDVSNMIQSRAYRTVYSFQHIGDTTSI
jgi:hypothetical protein